jgi:hypothetical protein
MGKFCLSVADSGLLSSRAARKMRTHESELLDGVLCLRDWRSVRICEAHI